MRTLIFIHKEMTYYILMGSVDISIHKIKPFSGDGLHLTDRQVDQTAG